MALAAPAWESAIRKLAGVGKSGWGIALAAWAAAMLGVALVLEHGFDMAPCALCLMQRLWFLAAGAIALGGVLRRSRHWGYPLATALAAAVGGAFSVRQLWLESLPPGQAPACGAGIDYLIEMAMVGEAFRAMVLGTADCAATPPLLGMSLAAWALAGFAVIVAGAARQWRAPAR